MGRFLVRPIGELPSNFRARLSTRQVHEILADYEKHGGDPAPLRGALYQLFETFDPTAIKVPRSFKTTLKRCRKNLSALLKMPTMVRGQSLNLQFFAEQTIQNIDRALHILEQKRPRGRPRASSGATTDSLVVAFLAKEFTRVYGEPHYEWISTLVQSAAPQVFTPAYSTPKHLHGRVQSVPPDALKELTDEVRAFLTIPPSPSKKKNSPQKKTR